MKKVLLSIALMLMGLSASAQVWEKTLEEGDQLKGTKDRMKYRIESPDGTQMMMFYGSSDKWKVGIVGNSFKPDKSLHVHSSTKNFLIYATIGFYNEDDQLVTKWDNCMMELTNIYRVAETSETLWGKKTTKGCREVVPYLLNEKGYVRIILPTFLGPDFDFKVPCIHNVNP